MIPLPTIFKTISQEDNKGVFEIGGLYPGYGLTVANGIRRALLSSLSGTAVTKVYIEGVSHEFSTMANVKEDVIQILLNLKKLKFVLPDNQPQQISLEAKGEKKVTGADFNLSPQIKLSNPEQHIATLVNSKARLSITITIESGVGYQTVEDRQSEKSVIGEISLDASFSPVERVSYRVENMRVGDRTDFNKIFLTIETNGIINPEAALIAASGILGDHFKLIADSFQPKKEKPVADKEKKAGKDNKTTKTASKVKKEDPKKLKIEDLGLSSRVATSLQEGGVKSVAGLVGKTSEKILEIEGMGEKGLKEIEKVLKKIGLVLKK
jgi:DNA-directed RNA polymerase subunit alpha